MDEHQCSEQSSVSDEYPLTVVQEEWLTLFFGYTYYETHDMTRAAAAAAVLDQEWAEFERTGQTRRACADGPPDMELELYRDPKTRPEELLYGPILYFVEVPVEEVPARRHRAALREVADMRDTLGLPPIELRWFMYVGMDEAGEAPRDAWYRRTCAAFAVQGVRRRPLVCEVRQHPHHLYDKLGFVLHNEPYAIYVQLYPSPAQIEDMQMDLGWWWQVPEEVVGVDMVGEHTLTEVVRHELAHCCQILAGFEELLDNGEMSDDEFERMAAEMVEDYGGLRQILHALRRAHSDLGRVLDYPAVLDSGEIVTARPDWHDGYVAA